MFQMLVFVSILLPAAPFYFFIVRKNRLPLRAAVEILGFIWGLFGVYFDENARKKLKRHEIHRRINGFVMRICGTLRNCVKNAFIHW